MTSYCNIGDKPKVYITFNGQQKQIYEPRVSPVEITTEDFTDHTSNYQQIGYQLSCYSTNNERGASIVVRDYEIRDNGAGYDFKYRYELWVRLCDSNTLTQYFNVDPSSISINQSITCANTETAKQKVRVHIKRVDSITDIFTVEGNAPCKIEVACGDCPPGYCRCEMSGYPGYCCLDCHATAEQIRVITNDLRSKNG
ncbi:hypothetical protein [Nostoc sp.]|uniref:hypothetical protein n=1 Tax=Nostoc sp. TaxID=1180 RepID=UPI002FF646A6